MRLGCVLTVVMVLVAGTSRSTAEEEATVFAVVSEIPKDKSRVPAKISIDGGVSDTRLLPIDLIQGNLIWKKLEICDALKLEGSKAAEGIRVTSVRVIDAGMLPMGLQSFAGDCLIKKAIEIAPLVD
ncbi:MAG: hypothetical protein ACT4OO_11125 [Nitrospiraceae bacterium]